MKKKTMTCKKVVQTLTLSKGNKRSNKNK